MTETSLLADALKGLIATGAGLVPNLPTIAKHVIHYPEWTFPMHSSPAERSGATPEWKRCIAVAREAIASTSMLVDDACPLREVVSRMGSVACLDVLSPLADRVAPPTRRLIGMGAHPFVITQRA